jgi:hypothetical protein
MENANQLEVISHCETQEHSGSTDTLIRQWLFRFGVNFEKDIAAILPLWQEAFGGIEAKTLESLFKRAFTTCKFFPKVADILEPLQAVEQADFEDEWQSLLDFCREWVHPDIHFSGTPQLPADIDHAARAAGGVQYLRECSQKELGWRKKAFIEDLQRSRKTGDLTGLLTGGELRKLLKTAAPSVALLPAAIPYTPAIGAARVSMESTGDVLTRMAAPIRKPPHFVDFEGRRAELERQNQFILEKYPTA